MKNTQSFIRLPGAKQGLLKGGDFGFDLQHKKLFAGFGNQNAQIMLEKEISTYPLMLINEWEIYDDAPMFSQTPFNEIYISGKVRNGVLNTPITTLPANAIPTTNKTFACVAGNTFIRVDINTDGEIIPISENEVGFISLEINFRR